jgi:hypothetical protein
MVDTQLLLKPLRVVIYMKANYREMFIDCKDFLIAEATISCVTSAIDSTSIRALIQSKELRWVIPRKKILLSSESVWPLIRE